MCGSMPASVVLQLMNDDDLYRRIGDWVICSCDPHRLACPQEVHDPRAKRVYLLVILDRRINGGLQFLHLHDHVRGQLDLVFAFAVVDGPYEVEHQTERRMLVAVKRIVVLEALEWRRIQFSTVSALASRSH